MAPPGDPLKAVGLDPIMSTDELSLLGELLLAVELLFA